jgi:hypothetical protein
VASVLTADVVIRPSRVSLPPYLGLAMCNPIQHLHRDHVMLHEE